MFSALFPSLFHMFHSWNSDEWVISLLNWFKYSSQVWIMTKKNKCWVTSGSECHIGLVSVVTRQSLRPCGSGLLFQLQHVGQAVYSSRTVVLLTAAVLWLTICSCVVAVGRSSIRRRSSSSGRLFFSRSCEKPVWFRESNHVSLWQER